MALQIATITNSIAALTVTGVKLKDKDQLKEGWDAYECPLFCPRPNEFVSAPTIVPVSLGSGSTRQVDVMYTLAYRYFHAPIGSGDLVKTWSDMVDNLFKIFDALIANDSPTGAIDLQIVNIGQFGIVQDGANNSFHGCDVLIRIKEFVN